MPICPECKEDIDHLVAFVKETNRYRIDLESCPKNIPTHLRGMANACLMGGPKTDGNRTKMHGSFCSYLEEGGGYKEVAPGLSILSTRECKLGAGDYQGLRWEFDQAVESSVTHTDFDCPECDGTIFTFEDEDDYAAVEAFLKGRLYTCDELCIHYTTKECITQEGWTLCNKPDKYKEIGDVADSLAEDRLWEGSESNPKNRK